MFAIKTILHPTDFSEPSRQALGLACRLAADYQAHLVVLSVLPEAAAPGFGTDGIRAALHHLEFPAEQVDVIHGADGRNPASEILRVAALCEADLIVMGAPDRQNARRWFSASVAETVLCLASCPVLTVSCGTRLEPTPLPCVPQQSVAGAGHPMSGSP